MEVVYLITGMVCLVFLITGLIVLSAEMKFKGVVKKPKLKIALSEYDRDDKYINWKDVPTEIPILKNKNGEIINISKLTVMWNPKKKFWVLIEKTEGLDILPGEIALLSEKEDAEDNVVFYYSAVPEPGNREGLRKLKNKFPGVRFYYGKVIFEG